MGAGHVPLVEKVKEADYCGIVSGARTDSVKDCNFNIIYGKLITAPMIYQCPINMEYSVVQILWSDSHSIVIGQIDGTYISDELVEDGKPDYARFAPLLWFREKGEYITSGKTIGKSRNIGNELKTTH